MSLLNIFSGLLDQHGDTVQQAALLAYLKQGEEAQPYLEAVLAARLAGTVYRSLSKEDQYEAARNETILSIAKWVKEHPRASQVSPTMLSESCHNQVRHFRARHRRRSTGRFFSSNRKLNKYSGLASVLYWSISLLSFDILIQYMYIL